MNKKLFTIIFTPLSLSLILFYVFKAPSVKGKKAMPQKASALVHTSKLSLPIKVVFKNDTDPVEQDSEFTLTANISTSLDINNINFKWVLSKGLTLIDGSLTQDTQLLNSKGLSLSIKLKQTDSKNHKIHLVALSKDPDKSFSKSFQYNSIDQKLINTYNDNLKSKTHHSIKK